MDAERRSGKQSLNYIGQPRSSVLGLYLDRKRPFDDLRTREYRTMSVVPLDCQFLFVRVEVHRIPESECWRDTVATILRIMCQGAQLANLGHLRTALMRLPVVGGRTATVIAQPDQRDQ